MKKKSACIAIVLLLAVMPLSLFACDRNKPKEILFTDIYRDDSSYKEFSSFELEMTLPVGCSVVTDTDNTDNGYIASLDAFVIKDGKGRLSVMKCGASEQMFPWSLGIIALRVKGNLIAVMCNDGTGSVFTADGHTVVSKKHFNKANFTTSTKIDDMVKILDDGLIAIASTYSAEGKAGYTSVMRPTTSGEVDDRGELVCRVKNAGNLSNVDGFDGRYVSVTDTKESSKYVNRIITVPYSSDGSPADLTGTANSVFREGSETNYYAEITYIGNSKFFVHEDWTVTKSDEYTYFDGIDYMKVSRQIYDASQDSLTPYESNIIFLNLTNKYYGVEKGGIDANGFIHDGYMYASYGLTIDEKKNAYYDQFILDSNLRVAVSLTGNLGISMKMPENKEISVFGLIMDYVDGYGYSPVMTGVMRVYDRRGNIVFEKEKPEGLNGYELTSAILNDGMIVAAYQNSEDSGDVLYGAYDMLGNLVIPFKYTKLDAFRGFYTIGQRVGEDGKLNTVLIGKDGKEVEQMSDGTAPLADMAVTSGNAKIFKLGCYMFTETKTVDGKEVKFYGIKNLNADSKSNVLIPARMGAGSILYSPAASPGDVFVFEKSTQSDNTVFTIYRLK